MIGRQRCGCINELHSNGVVARSFTCVHHARMQTGLDVGFDYYSSLAVFDESKCPMLSGRRKEFIDNFGVPELTDYEYVLEVGCGISAVAPLFMQQGWKYFGLEPAPWPARWMRETYDVDVFEQTIEELDYETGFDAVVMAHCLEHVADPVVAMTKILESMNALGSLYIIVPYGPDDPCNPDHRWFFNESSLRALLERIGFAIKSCDVKPGNPRERYVYCEATK